MELTGRSVRRMIHVQARRHKARLGLLSRSLLLFFMNAEFSKIQTEQQAGLAEGNNESRNGTCSYLQVWRGKFKVANA